MDCLPFYLQFYFLFEISYIWHFSGILLLLMSVEYHSLGISFQLMF